MKVSIEQSGCISCGVCIDICPEVFQFTAEGLAEVYSDASAETASKVKEAADDCPTDVITIED